MPKAAFNKTVSALCAPPIPVVQQWVQSYDGGFGPVMDLSQAVPGYPPHPDMLKWLGEAASDPANARYGKIEGEKNLRAVYAEHTSDLYKASIEAKNVHITSGCNQAFISTIMAIAGTGDTILMSNPYYFNHETTLSMLGIKTEIVDTNPDGGFCPIVSKFAKSIDKSVKAIILVTPNNPTGTVYSESLLREIFDLCQANGIWLILDETYRDFLPVETPQPHSLFSIKNWEENLVQLYSFSKSFCIPGHRLGAILGGEKLVSEVVKVMDNLQICAPRPPQAAVAKALPKLGSWREENRREIAARSKTLKAVMSDLPDWEISAIGAYFSYIKHPFNDISSVDVAKSLATKRGVICIPGEFFGKNQEQYLRFAFANADQAALGNLKMKLDGFTP